LNGIVDILMKVEKKEG